MGMNFPNPPLTVGQQFAGYTWDGEKWLAPTPSGGGVSEAPNDALMYGRKSLTWQRAVDVAGDTMTGVLTVASGSLVIQSASFPSLYVFDTSGKQFRQFSAFNRYYLQNSTDSVSLLEAIGNTLATSTVLIPGTTPSTAPTTGALQVAGGVGIGASAYVAGNVAVNYHSNLVGFNGVGIGAPDKTVAGNAGISIFSNDASAQMSAFFWMQGAAVGTDRHLDIGCLEAGVAWRDIWLAKQGGSVKVGNSSYGGTLSVLYPTASSSPTTGALTVAGGVGVGGKVSVGAGNDGVTLTTADTSLASYFRADNSSGYQMRIGIESAAGGQMAVGTSGNSMVVVSPHNIPVHFGNTNTVRMTIGQNTGDVSIASTTASTSPTTGALTVAGGIGAGKTIFSGAPTGAMHFSSSGAATVNVPNGSSAAVSSVHYSILLIAEVGATGYSAVFLLGITGVTLLGASGLWSATSTPAAGALGVFWDGTTSTYRAYNYRGGDALIKTCLINAF